MCRGERLLSSACTHTGNRNGEREQGVSDEGCGGECSEGQEADGTHRRAAGQPTPTHTHQASGQTGHTQTENKHQNRTQPNTDNMCTQQTNTSTNQRTNNNKNTQHKKIPRQTSCNHQHTQQYTQDQYATRTPATSTNGEGSALCACLHSTLSTALNTLQNSTKTSKNHHDQQYEISSQHTDKEERTVAESEWQGNICAHRVSESKRLLVCAHSLQHTNACYHYHEANKK